MAKAGVENPTLIIEDDDSDHAGRSTNKPSTRPGDTEASGSGSGSGEQHETDHLNVKKFLSSLNINNYATKKTFAQGLLDLALLSSNATQLHSLLSEGRSNEFFDVLLYLLITSIVLQVVQAAVCVTLGVVFDINKVDEHKAAEICNNVCVVIIIVIVAINIVISAFNIKTTDFKHN